MKEFEQPEIQLVLSAKGERQVRRETDPQTGIVTETIQRIHLPERDGFQFTGAELSDGTVKFYNLFSGNIFDASWSPKGRNFSQRLPAAAVITLEEPENGLHPSTQRLFVDKLATWKQARQRMFSPPRQTNFPVFVFITTHSPFILSRLMPEMGHHVVCLKNCGLVTQTLVDADQPPKLGKLRAIANVLLGVGLSDFVPERVVYAEGSVEVLLRALSKHIEDDLPDFFVNPSGDADGAQRLSFVRQHLKALNRIRSRWPENTLLDPKIDFILDDASEAEAQRAALSPEEDGIRIFSLGQSQLEDVYPLDWVNAFIAQDHPKADPWDGKGRIARYLFEVLDIAKTDQGAFKCALAEYVAGKITSQKELAAHLPDVMAFWKAWTLADAA